MKDVLDTTERRISVQSDDGKRNYEIMAVASVRRRGDHETDDGSVFWSVKRRIDMRFQRFESGVSVSVPEAVKRARKAIERAESRIGTDDVH